MCPLCWVLKKVQFPSLYPLYFPTFYLDSDPSLPEGRAGPDRERSGPHFVLSFSLNVVVSLSTIFSSLSTVVFALSFASPPLPQSQFPLVFPHLARSLSILIIQYKIAGVAVTRG